MNKISLSSLVAALAALLGLSSCTSLTPEPVKEPTAYERFITTTAYPTTMEVYEDAELMKKANGSCPIYICLDQQRGRLYVDDQVAMDWPVSTGVRGRETPTGSFKINLKEPYHESGRYGNIYDGEGKCVKHSADMMNDSVPEGGRFAGSPMPNWMRLTTDGVGMHTGKVRAGCRLSHGCIRTPNAIARKLYSITRVGTPVTVSHSLEQRYPARQALADKAAAEQKAKEEADKKAAEKKN